MNDCRMRHADGYKNEVHSLVAHGDFLKATFSALPFSATDDLQGCYAWA